MKNLFELDATFWWAPVNGEYSVPTFAECGIQPKYQSDIDDANEWRAMREQLWAIREGLA